MPRTTIIRRTWHCTMCRYESDRLVGACSTLGCAGAILEETDPLKCGSMTVIGIEDIEAEIAAINTQRLARLQLPLSLGAQDTYRQERVAEMNNAIAGIRLREKRVGLVP